MPQSHTHLRTLRMIRKSHPHQSVHSVIIRNYRYLIRRVRNSSYLIHKTRYIRANTLKNIKTVLRMNTALAPLGGTSSAKEVVGWPLDLT